MRVAQIAATELRAAYAAVAIAEDRLDKAIAAVKANHAEREVELHQLDQQLAICERQLLIGDATAASNQWRNQ
jgi:hypothetical protein